MSEGGVCSWCEGKGTLFESEEAIPTTFCGWCDGTGVQKANFLGHYRQDQHRSCGPIRAWCDECREWCFANPVAGCRCCKEAPSE